MRLVKFNKESIKVEGKFGSIIIYLNNDDSIKVNIIPDSDVGYFISNCYHYSGSVNYIGGAYIEMNKQKVAKTPINKNIPPNPTSFIEKDDKAEKKIKDTLRMGFIIRDPGVNI